ncbi:MAG: hypothetical protein KGI54_14645 [Pseudomonadota bacterium]|nr:hypothetical protein [Pseudomonadota bacterium]
MNVMIATPSLDGNLSIEYVTSLLKTTVLLKDQQIDYVWSVVRGDCFIDKARNNLVQSFLDSSCTDLFFIDADQGWNEKSFLKLLHDSHEIVAGAVPKKDDDLCFNNPEMVTDEKLNCVIENGLIQARHIGTGFMRIKRSALEKMIKAYPERYNPGYKDQDIHYYGLFETQVRDGLFWGEDLVFCKKWCELGEFIWIEPNIDFQHAGRKCWKGNFLEYLTQTCTVEVSKKSFTAPVLAGKPYQVYGEESCQA